MEIKDIKNIIKKIVQNLVDKNYDAIYKDDYLQKMSVQTMREIIIEYNDIFTMPPEPSFDKFIIYSISENEVTVDFRLWASNEESDLTLICRFKTVDNKPRYTVEDMHIL